MKTIKTLILFLFVASSLIAQSLGENSYFTKNYWSLSGTTLSPISSAYKLGFTYPLRTGNKVQMSFTSDSTDYAPYELMTHSTDFEGVPDYTFSLGYNSSQSKVAEPIFIWNIENNYKVGTTRYLESYFQYQMNGYTIRPIFMQFDKADTTGGSTNLQFQTGTGISLYECADDIIYAQLSRGGFSFLGYPGQTANTNFTIIGKNGYGALFQMGGNGSDGKGLIIEPIDKWGWDFKVGGSAPVFTLGDDQVGINNYQANATLGIQTSVAQKDGATTLQLKAQTGQSTGLLLNRSAADGYLSGFTVEGYAWIGGYLTGKRFSIGDGTDKYGIDVASDKLQIYNDNATPASIFSLDSLGRVGLGTSPSAYKLHIYDTAGYPLMVESSQSYSVMSFKSATNTSTCTIGTGGSGALEFENKLVSAEIAGGISLVTQPTAGDYRKVNIVGGNIGVNTLTPYHRLSAMSSTATNLNAFNFTDTDINKIRTNAATSSDTSSVNAKFSNSGSPTFTVMGKDGANLFRADSAGIFVGVQQVTVPDYVFDPTYKQNSISEMRDFYTANKHLPTMPSEKDVKSKDVNVMEYSMRLLETLEIQAKYIVELEERIARLEKQKH